MLAGREMHPCFTRAYWPAGNVPVDLETDMATQKKGMIETAIEAVASVFADERQPTLRRPAKTGSKTAAKKVARKMDTKLVSTMEDYEVKYLAQKHKVTQKAVKEAVGRVGHSRNKVEAELKKKEPI